MNVLLVEDNIPLTNNISEFFKDRKINLVFKRNGELGYYEALTGNYDVIVLDWMLPKMDGIQILKGLRENNIDAPIIMLTAKGTLDNKVEAFNKGADDYLVKPFQMEELLVRVLALGKRKNKELVNELIIGDLCLNESTHVLASTNEDQNIPSIPLSNKEYLLLERLIMNKGKTLTKDYLIDHVWVNCDTGGDNNSLDVFISFLRKKIKALNSEVNIKTIRGIGYQIDEK